MFFFLLAADAPAVLDDQGSETIVVTGERVARTVQDTATSVAVTTAEDLDRQAAPSRLEDVLALIPNVQLGSGDQGPAIRGQDTTGILLGADAFLGGSRPRATVQVDGRALGFNEFIYGLNSVWDVARVEVFRGPQTTSQGRNAIAGAIFIETNAPSYAFEGRARALVAEQDTVQVSGAVSGPIVADQLAIRLAADYRESTVPIRYDRISVAGADITEDDHKLVRARLRAEPRALPGLRLDVIYSHLESNGPQGVTVDPPFRDRVRGEGNGGYWGTNVDSLVGKLDYAATDKTRLAVTAAYGDSRIERFSPPRGGNGVVRAEDLSLEAIVAHGDASDRIQALAGVYYLDFDQSEAIDLSAFLGIGDFTDQQRSLGLFGEATVALTDQLSLTGSLRYQRDSQDRVGTLGPFALAYDRSFDAFLPKAELRYRVSEAVTIGASARRGFNPGGTTISFLTGFIDEFEAETLWNYEVFARTALLDDTLNLNATAFYTDFVNSQRQLITPVTLPDGTVQLQGEVNNAPSARSYGLELEARWRATPRVTLAGGIGLLDTEIEEALVPTDPIVGKDFQRAPSFSASASIAWQPIDGFDASAQLRHNSRYFSDDENTPSLAVGASTQVDAKLSYTWRAFTLAGYARNLFDEFTETQIFSPTLASVNEPRELGVSLEARF